MAIFVLSKRSPTRFIIYNNISKQKNMSIEWKTVAAVVIAVLIVIAVKPIFEKALTSTGHWDAE